MAAPPTTIPIAQRLAAGYLESYRVAVRRADGCRAPATITCSPIRARTYVRVGLGLVEALDEDGRSIVRIRWDAVRDVLRSRT